MNLGHDDVAFLTRVARSAAETASARTPTPTVRPGTVASSEDGITQVVLDGDSLPVFATAIVPEPSPDDRVMVLLVPPSGAFVVGFVGESRASWGTGGTGGGGGADEVWIDPSAPVVRDELLLWVDTDATPTGGSWSPLTVQPPYGPYSGWRSPQIRQTGDVVELRGLIHCNGAAAGSFIANGLPDVPPGSGLIFLGSSDSATNTTRIDVQPGGYLVNSGPTPLDYLSLSNVRYSVA